MNRAGGEERYTRFTKVILASMSEVRKKLLSKYFDTVECVSHKADEDLYKNQKRSPKEIALQIAKEKVLSVAHNFPNEMIVGSDQILVCEKKILSKPKNLEAAIEKLLFLKNKTHKLYSSIYVIKNKNFYFKQVKVASLFFANVSQSVLESYVKVNKKTVLTTVGSYKIEENSKYRFISIINGDLETILGFPVKDFIEKIKYEK